MAAAAKSDHLYPVAGQRSLQRRPDYKVKNRAFRDSARAVFGLKAGI
jgi:hypothetical protein